MHIPDGFFSAPTAAAGAAAAAAGLGVSMRKAARYLQERQVPLAGVVAAFVFAAHMINFPVGAGTSGHLIGGVLAAVLVGPWTAVVALAVVVVVQALVFADGGVTALGLNLLNLALVAPLGGYVVFLGLRRLLPAGRGALMAASGLAAGVSVVLAALAFVAEYAVGGAGEVALATVAAAMVGVHVLIGVGEAVITAVTVGAVLAVRPDLVHGGSHARAAVDLRSVQGS